MGNRDVTRRPVEKSRQEVNAVLPDLQDYTALDNDLQLDIPQLRIRIHEPLLLAEGGGHLLAADLRNVGLGLCAACAP